MNCLVLFSSVYWFLNYFFRGSSGDLLELGWRVRGFEGKELLWYNENFVGRRVSLGYSGFLGFWGYVEILEDRSKVWNYYVNVVE